MSRNSPTSEFATPIDFDQEDEAKRLRRVLKEMEKDNPEIKDEDKALWKEIDELAKRQSGADEKEKRRKAIEDIIKFNTIFIDSVNNISGVAATLRSAGRSSKAKEKTGIDGLKLLKTATESMAAQGQEEFLFRARVNADPIGIKQSLLNKELSKPEVSSDEKTTLLAININLSGEYYLISQCNSAIEQAETVSSLLNGNVIKRVSGWFKNEKNELDKLKKEEKDEWDFDVELYKNDPQTLLNQLQEEFSSEKDKEKIQVAKKLKYVASKIKEAAAIRINAIEEKSEHYKERCQSDKAYERLNEELNNLWHQYQGTKNKSKDERGEAATQLVSFFEMMCAHLEKTKNSKIKTNLVEYRKQIKKAGAFENYDGADHNAVSIAQNCYAKAVSGIPRGKPMTEVQRKILVEYNQIEASTWDKLHQKMDQDMVDNVLNALEKSENINKRKLRYLAKIRIENFMKKYGLQKTPQRYKQVLEEIKKDWRCGREVELTPSEQKIIIESEEELKKKLREAHAKLDSAIMNLDTNQGQSAQDNPFHLMPLADVVMVTEHMQKTLLPIINVLIDRYGNRPAIKKSLEDQRKAIETKIKLAIESSSKRMKGALDADVDKRIKARSGDMETVEKNLRETEVEDSTLKSILRPKTSISVKPAIPTNLAAHALLPERDPQSRVSASFEMGGYRKVFNEDPTLFQAVMTQAQRHQQSEKAQVTFEPVQLYEQAPLPLYYAPSHGLYTPFKSDEYSEKTEKKEGGKRKYNDFMRPEKEAKEKYRGSDDFDAQSTGPSFVNWQIVRRKFADAVAPKLMALNTDLLDLGSLNEKFKGPDLDVNKLLSPTYLELVDAASRFDQHFQEIESLCKRYRPERDFFLSGRKHTQELIDQYKAKVKEQKGTMDGYRDALAKKIAKKLVDDIGEVDVNKKLSEEERKQLFNALIDIDPTTSKEHVKAFRADLIKKLKDEISKDSSPIFEPAQGKFKQTKQLKYNAKSKCYEIDTLLDNLTVFLNQKDKNTLNLLKKLLKGEIDISQFDLSKESKGHFIFKQWVNNKIKTHEALEKIPPNDLFHQVIYLSSIINEEESNKFSGMILGLMENLGVNEQLRCLLAAGETQVKKETITIDSRDITNATNLICKVLSKKDYVEANLCKVDVENQFNLKVNDKQAKADHFVDYLHFIAARDPDGKKLNEIFNALEAAVNASEDGINILPKLKGITPKDFPVPIDQFVLPLLDYCEQKKCVPETNVNKLLVTYAKKRLNRFLNLGARQQDTVSELNAGELAMLAKAFELYRDELKFELIDHGVNSAIVLPDHSKGKEKIRRLAELIAVIGTEEDIKHFVKLCIAKHFKENVTEHEPANAVDDWDELPDALNTILKAIKKSPLAANNDFTVLFYQVYFSEQVLSQLGARNLENNKFTEFPEEYLATLEEHPYFEEIYTHMSGVVLEKLAERKRNPKSIDEEHLKRMLQAVMQHGSSEAKARLLESALNDLVDEIELDTEFEEASQKFKEKIKDYHLELSEESQHAEYAIDWMFDHIASDKIPLQTRLVIFDYFNSAKPKIDVPAQVRTKLLQACLKDSNLLDKYLSLVKNDNEPLGDWGEVSKLLSLDRGASTWDANKQKVVDQLVKNNRYSSQTNDLQQLQQIYRVQWLRAVCENKAQPLDSPGNISWLESIRKLLDKLFRGQPGVEASVKESLKELKFKEGVLLCAQWCQQNKFLSEDSVSRSMLALSKYYISEILDHQKNEQPYDKLIEQKEKIIFYSDSYAYFDAFITQSNSVDFQSRVSGIETFKNTYLEGQDKIPEFLNKIVVVVLQQLNPNDSSYNEKLDTLIGHIRTLDAQNKHVEKLLSVLEHLKEKGSVNKLKSNILSVIKGIQSGTFSAFKIDDIQALALILSVSEKEVLRKELLELQKNQRHNIDVSEYVADVIKILDSDFDVLVANEALIKGVKAHEELIEKLRGNMVTQKFGNLLAILPNTEVQEKEFTIVFDDFKGALIENMFNDHDKKAIKDTLLKLFESENETIYFVRLKQVVDVFSVGEYQDADFSFKFKSKVAQKHREVAAIIDDLVTAGKDFYQKAQQKDSQEYKKLSTLKAGLRAVWPFIEDPKCEFIKDFDKEQVKNKIYKIYLNQLLKSMVDDADFKIPSEFRDIMKVLGIDKIPDSQDEAKLAWATLPRDQLKVVSQDLVGDAVQDQVSFEQRQSLLAQLIKEGRFEAAQREYACLKIYIEKYEKLPKPEFNKDSFKATVQENSSKYSAISLRAAATGFLDELLGESETTRKILHEKNIDDRKMRLKADLIQLTGPIWEYGGKDTLGDIRLTRATDDGKKAQVESCLKAIGKNNTEDNRQKIEFAIDINEKINSLLKEFVEGKKTEYEAYVAMYATLVEKRENLKNKLDFRGRSHDFYLRLTQAVNNCEKMILAQPRMRLNNVENKVIEAMLAFGRMTAKVQSDGSKLSGATEIRYQVFQQLNNYLVARNHCAQTGVDEPKLELSLNPKEQNTPFAKKLTELGLYHPIGQPAPRVYVNLRGNAAVLSSGAPSNNGTQEPAPKRSSSSTKK